MRTLDVIIPCYNEEPCIDLIYQHLSETLNACDDLQWSVIFVDDGSSDHTLEKIKQLSGCTPDGPVRYVSFSRNFGKESAIYAGLSYSTAEYVVLMDADLQHPPELLPQMMEALEEGYDCCGAKRVTRGGEPPVRSMLSKAFYRLTNIFMNVDLHNGGSDFQMMKRPVVEAMLSMPERGRFTKGILSWVGFETKWIEYENVERVAGTTKWSVRSLTRYALSGIISFSKAPFLWAVWLGGLIDLAALVAAVIFIVRIAVRGGVWGPSILIVLGLFFMGTVFILLGMLGEYMAQIYQEVQRRPVFIVKQTNISK